MRLDSLEVRPASLAEARPFIERCHYSKSCPAGMNIFFGVEHGQMADLVSQEFYAVACYGISSSPQIHKSLSRQTGSKVTLSNLLELRRLCRREPAEEIPLTWFLSQCHKRLKRKGYKFIVSFSDPDFGHNGGIYRAANFVHLGKTKPEIHFLEPSGRFIHRKTLTNQAAAAGSTVQNVVAEKNLQPSSSSPKDRWLLKIGK